MVAGGFKIRRARPGTAALPTPPSSLAIIVSSPNLNAATIGLGYAWDVFATGGTEPYTYALSSGTIMSGVAFDTASGGATGFPTTAQTRTGLVVKVTDNVGATAFSTPFDVTVTDPAWSAVAVTPATLSSALGSAAAGTQLVCGAGTYTLDTFGITKTGVGVQILGGSGVSFNYIQASSCARIWFKNINVTGTNGFGISVFFDDSDRMVADGLTLSNITGGRGILWGGAGATNGVGQSCVVNVVSGDGMSAVDASQLLLTSNVVKNWNANAFAIYGVTNYICEKNAIGNFIDPGDGGHPDAIATAGYTGRGSTGTIRWNRFDFTTGGSAGSNGITFMEAQDTFNIYGNSSFGCNGNGCSTSLCTHVAVRNNFVQGLSPGANALILTRDGSDQIIMNYNFAFDTLIAGIGVPSTNVTISGNTSIATATSLADTSARNTFLALNPLIPAAA